MLLNALFFFLGICFVVLFGSFFPEMMMHLFARTAFRRKEVKAEIIEKLKEIFKKD